MLLGLVSSCGSPKFNIGDCIKGETYTFQVVMRNIVNYKLEFIEPKYSNYYGFIVSSRIKIADRAYRKVTCPNDN